MFLVKDMPHGMTNLVYTWGHPRNAGYAGVVEADITLDYDQEALVSWPDGHAGPEICVGRDPNNPKHHKVFKYASARESAGYEPVPGEPLVFGAWSDYLRSRHPDLLDDEQWYGYLDELDEASRRRRQRTPAPAVPADRSRDAVAAWVAKKHLLADSGIQAVWYLPQGAPPEEIRLLEVNDRLAGADAQAEAIDFGLDVDGARFRLLVADVTSAQLDQMRQAPSRLPSGWSLDEKTEWRRGA